MNNLLSYWGLVDARISASEKDYPVLLTAKFSALFCQQFLVFAPRVKGLAVWQRSFVINYVFVIRI
jgi:hypothetical protein